RRRGHPGAGDRRADAPPPVVAGCCTSRPGPDDIGRPGGEAGVMTEARIASPTVAARPTLRRPWLRQLVAAYLSVAAAAAVFGIGYGLGQLDSGACTMSGWACAVPHALLLAAFLAAALAT